MKWSFVPFTEMEKFVYSNVNTSLEDVDNFFSQKKLNFIQRTKFFTKDNMALRFVKGNR